MITEITSNGRKAGLENRREMEMKKMGKKVNAALLALTMTVGSMTYPTKDAKAGVVLASIGGVASNGSGMILLPAAVSIGMMFGGLGIFIYSCYAFLDKIEVGNNKAAAKAMGFLTLDKGSAEEVQADLRTKIMNSYKELGMNENNADYLAQIVLHKTSQIKVEANSSVEVLFSAEELSQLVNSISETNPELAQKITDDFTKSSL